MYQEYSVTQQECNIEANNALLLFVAQMKNPLLNAGMLFMPASNPVKTEKMTRLGIEPRPSWTYTSSSNQLSYQVLQEPSW